MDGYVSKPIQFDELLEFLVTESALLASFRLRLPPALEEAPEEVWDPQVALAASRRRPGAAGGRKGPDFCDPSPRGCSPPVETAIAKEESSRSPSGRPIFLRSAIVTFSAQKEASDAAATDMEGFSRPEEFEEAAPGCYQSLETSVQKLRRWLRELQAVLCPGGSCIVRSNQHKEISR